MVSPTMRSPRECSRAATVELSTPPDIATAVMESGMDGDTAQLARAGRDCVDQRVYLLDGVRTANGNTKTGSSVVTAEPDRGQHVRRLGSAARTCGPARHGVAPQVERDQQGLRVDPLEDNVGGVRDARRLRAVHTGARHVSKNAGFHSVAQFGETGDI